MTSSTDQSHFDWACLITPTSSCLSLCFLRSSRVLYPTQMICWRIGCVLSFVSILRCVALLVTRRPLSKLLCFNVILYFRFSSPYHLEGRNPSPSPNLAATRPCSQIYWLAGPATLDHSRVLSWQAAIEVTFDRGGRFSDLSIRSWQAQICNFSLWQPNGWSRDFLVT